MDAAWAALDAQLVRRSAAARALGVPPVVAAADAALEASPETRQDRENDLSRELRAAWPSVPPGPVRDELAAAASRVSLARSFHSGAVTNARALRRRRLVRALHLAGHRDMPRFFDMDETDFSDEAGPPLT